MGNPFVPVQNGPPPHESLNADTTTNDFAPALNSTVRDAKGRIPASLNVGGTHPSKRHPALRHFKD